MRLTSVSSCPQGLHIHPALLFGFTGITHDHNQKPIQTGSKRAQQRVPARNTPCSFSFPPEYKPSKPKGMSVTDTLEFVLSCYDFDGTGRLTVDEISLAFKSTVTGMCKLEGAGGLKACPRDVEFEAAAINAFERRGEGPDRFKVKVRKYLDFRRSGTRFACFLSATSGYSVCLAHARSDCYHPLRCTSTETLP